jgi:UDP-N-acetylglucosamine 1-carboxyvinyltransferase
MSKTSQKLGQFVQQLRQKKGLSTTEFADLLQTSSGVINRLESGHQHFTPGNLDKISNIFNRSVIKLGDNTTDFIIHGGRTLTGSLTVNKSKNGAMGLLCASLLNKGKTTLYGIPYIEEVERLLEVMESIGVEINREGDKLEILPPKTFDLENIDYKAASKTRSIIMFLGPLIHCEKNFTLPNNQGCKLGKRTITPHLYGLEKMGVKIKVEEKGYKVKVGELKNCSFVMPEQGDTATENILIAAARIKGTTKIKFASTNYMVMDVIGILRAMGVGVTIEPNCIVVEGKPNINLDLEYYNSEDPIEAMTFIAIAIVTESSVAIKRCPIDYLELELLKLEMMGQKYKRSKVYKSNNKTTNLVDLTFYPSNLKALADKITTQPYPGINIDNLPFFVPIATQAKGSTLIHDWVYEDRAIYFTELNRLDAKVTLADTHRVIIEGKTEFKPTQMICPPALRPSMLILIAMLRAPGVSILRNVYSIRRGYQDIAERLNEAGAKIEIIENL